MVHNTPGSELSELSESKARNPSLNNPECVYIHDCGGWKVTFTDDDVVNGIIYKHLNSSIKGHVRTWNYRCKKILPDDYQPIQTIFVDFMSSLVEVTLKNKIGCETNLNICGQV